MKFGTWHPYTVPIVTSGLAIERVWRPRARAPRAVHTPLQMSGIERRKHEE